MTVKSFDNKDHFLPPTAVAIRVTNILTPYFVRIYEIIGYEDKLNAISKKLLLTKKRISNAEKKCMNPKVGQTVLVHNRSDKNVELPAWLCRGLICSVDNSEEAFNVLLTDYGVSVELETENFIPCSVDSISEKYLSYTVGLYNVLPAIANCDSEEKFSTLIIDEWSTLALQYTKELIGASSAIYFDHLASDEHGKHYGEFYLNIEDTIITLSKALALNSHAACIDKKLIQFLRNPKNCEDVRKAVINDETIFYINNSKEPSSDPNGDKCNVLSTSYMNKKDKFRRERYSYSHNNLDKEEEKILIYGATKYDYLNSVMDAKFPANIHKAWSSVIKSSMPKKMQSCMWPAIRKGMDVVAVGPAKCGKTFGYAFALCGLLATNPNLPQGVNPSALILCSSSSEVLEVSSVCTELLVNYLTINCVAAINGKPERKLAAEMFNGCQILATTPRFLVRFMNSNKKFLNFENLQFLVFDNGDSIFDKYYDSISKLFRKYKLISNREVQSKNVLQIIITAKQWTEHLRKIAFTLLGSPFICITSFIEAAVFKSVRPKLYIMNSKIKKRKVLDLLGDEYCKSRTIIVCMNADEAEQLSEFLKQQSIETLLAHENMNFIHLQGIRHCWNACVTGCYPVLICTDEVLSDMNITNALWLIHYSIALRYKTQFSFRFSTLLDSLQMEKSNCKVTIIADENNNLQFLSIIKIMQRMNVSITPNMLQNIEQIMITLDKQRKDFPICNNVKSWGFCPNQSSCLCRHGIISEIDAPNLDIRINDKVKFRVIRVNDVNCVSARILSYIKSDTSEEIEFSNVEYMRFTMDIQEFYSSIENRKRCEEIDVGTVCGLEQPVDTFKRVQILHVHREEKTDNLKSVDVKCIDSGTILVHVHVHRLLKMPEKLINYPVQVVDVFLTGIVPHDDEYVWNNCAFDSAYQWFQQNVNERCYTIGKVKLHLKGTIWVDTLEVGTKLIGYKDLVGFSLKAELLKKDHAIEYDKHLSQMYKLCKDAGFSEINGHDLNVLINRTT